jgi:hypothetical protein
LTVVLDAQETKTIVLYSTATSECDFDLIGVEYETSNGILARCNFSDKIRDSLKFAAICSLPPLDVHVKIALNAEDMDAVELYTGEIVELDLIVGTQIGHDASWTPSRITLETNANLLTSDKRKSKNEIEFRTLCKYKVQAPSQAKSETVYFKIEYFDAVTNKSRSTSRNVELFVRECLVVETSSANVVSVRNVLSTNYVTLFAQQDDAVELMPGLTAHVLCDNAVIPWTSSDRHGLLAI